MTDLQNYMSLMTLFSTHSRSHSFQANGFQCVTQHAASRDKISCPYETSFSSLKITAVETKLTNSGHDLISLT